MSKSPDITVEDGTVAAPPPQAKRLSPKRLTQFLLGGAGVILLSGGGIAYGLHSKIADQQTIAAGKEAQVGSDQQIASRYQATLDTYNDTAKRVQFLESSVSAKSYVPTLLTQLQTLAAATHLTVTAVRPTASAPPAVAAAPAPAADASGTATVAKKATAPPYDTIDIAVDVTGTYANTAAFLYGLTRFPKIISVASAQMHPEGQGTTPGAPSSPQVTTNLKLTAYMFKDDEAKPTPAPGAPTITASSVVPPPAAGSVAGAAGRATAGAVQATRAANSQSQTTLGTL